MSFLSRWFGATTGAFFGAGAGFIIGSIFPVVGSTVGALIGTTLGGISGWFAEDVMSKGLDFMFGTNYISPPDADNIDLEVKDEFGFNRKQQVHMFNKGLNRAAVRDLIDKVAAEKEKLGSTRFFPWKWKREKQLTHLLAYLNSNELNAHTLVFDGQFYNLMENSLEAKTNATSQSTVDVMRATGGNKKNLRHVRFAEDIQIKTIEDFVSEDKSSENNAENNPSNKEELAERDPLTNRTLR